MLYSTPPYRGPARLVQGLSSFVFIAIAGTLLVLGSVAAAQTESASPPADAPAPAVSTVQTEGENPEAAAPTVPPEATDGPEEAAPDEEPPPSVTQSMESFVKSLRISALWRGNDLRQWGILLGAIFLGLLLGKF